MLELHQPEHTGNPCFDLGPGQPTQFQPECELPATERCGNRA
jgi:hypothetical protein